MKKLFLCVIFLAIFASTVFTDPEDQEEIDYLLFALNSSSQFENERQASIQLDNLANHFASKNLYSGQIQVYGYSAAAANDIDPLILSRDRASFVINELIKRGVPREYFSNPVGYGSVDLWGSNTTEQDKIPNRRVRIIIDGNIITPAIVQNVVPVPEPSFAIAEKEEAIAQDNSQSEHSFKFPWILLLALLAILAAFLLSRLLKRAKPAKTAMVHKPAIISKPVAAAVAKRVVVVNLDEEIRNRAYELYQMRNGQDEDDVADWHIAVHQICTRYEGDGYHTYEADESWWARRSTNGD